MPNPKYVKKKTVICSECGSSREIRSDSKSIICHKCSSSKTAKNKDHSKRKTGDNIVCLKCSSNFYRRKSESKLFCSRKCSYSYKYGIESEDRNCKNCGNSFTFKHYKSSNSRGTYCSLSCRDQSYLNNSIRYGNIFVRSGWKSIRDKFINENPFCCYCAKSNIKLQVHHIIPYRMTRDNNEWNLVTLCQKHHSKFEKLSNQIEKIGLQNGGENLAGYIRDSFRMRSIYITNKLKEINHAR